MSQSRPQSQNRIAQTVVLGLCVWLTMENQPFIEGEQVYWLPLVTLFVVVVLGMNLIVYFLLRLAQFFEWLASHQAIGTEGTAFWGKYKDIKHELLKHHEGPFWGMTSTGLRKRGLFSDFKSNALAIGPSGSGKGVNTVIPMGFSIRYAKVFADFKGEIISILKKPLEKRGEIVRKLNPAGLWQDIVGKTDCLNPLDGITDNFCTTGALRDVMDDCRELSMLLYPDPEESNEDDYWKEGSRRVIVIAIVIEVMIDGYDAVLSSVALLLEDRVEFERALRWVVGVDLKGSPDPNGRMPIEQTDWAKTHDEQDVKDFAALIRARANNLLALMCSEDSKTFDSFLSGAQQALGVYAFGRLAPAMKRSTFDVNDLKNPDVITSLFIVADASRMEIFKDYISIMQWYILNALKRHPNKKQPVYFILDEATNYKVPNLDSLMTWGRGYGVRLLIIFQAISAYKKTYGEDALETLLSETEIKLFLPGQRSPEVLKLISDDILGKQSIMNASVSLEQNSSADEQMSENGKEMMTTDEIRRTDKAIWIVRQAPAMLIDMASYAQIHPYREQADINPFYNKPFKQKIKLRLKERKGKKPAE